MGMLTTIRELFRSPGDLVDRADLMAYELRARDAGQVVPTWQLGKPQWPRREISTYDHDAYRRIALVFRCVQYLANAAGSAPLRVYEAGADGEDIELATHPLRTLVMRPNADMGEKRFLSFVAMNMAVCGFTVIEKERNRGDQVIGLWPMRSAWLRPIPRAFSAPAWEYRIPGLKTEPVIKEPEDVIVVTYADLPDQDATGIGPLEVLLRQVGVSNDLTDFLKAFLERGAMPLYVGIPSDDPDVAAQFEDPKTRQAFRDAWRQQYGGLARSVEPLISVGLKEIKQLGFDFNELAYPELHKLNEVAICEGFGIPPIVLGTQVGLERSTFSNTKEASRSFYESTMQYIWDRIDDAFTRSLLPEFVAGPRTFLGFDTTDVPALKDDLAPKRQAAVEAFRSGMISRHAGQREGEWKEHGEDVFLVPFNLVPVQVEGTMAERSKYASIIEHGQGGVSGELPRANGHLPIDTGELRPVEPTHLTRDGRRYRNLRALSPAAIERRATARNAAVWDMDRLAVLLAPRVRDFLAEQGSRLASIATRSRVMVIPVVDGVTERRAIEGIDWAIEDDALRTIMQGWWESVGEAAFGTASSIVGTDISWDVSNPWLQRLSNVLGGQITQINATTRADIERIVLQELTDGTTPVQLGDAIRGLFEQTYRNRHLTVARTESMIAYGEASTLAYEASGQVDDVEVHDNASHTESYTGAADGLTCAQRNGLVVPLARGPFHVRSDHPNGSAALSPIVRPLEGA